MTNARENIQWIENYNAQLFGHFYCSPQTAMIVISFQFQYKTFKRKFSQALRHLSIVFVLKSSFITDLYGFPTLNCRTGMGVFKITDFPLMLLLPHYSTWEFGLKR